MNIFDDVSMRRISYGDHVWSVTDQCRRHKCPSDCCRCTVDSVRVVHRSQDDDDIRSHTLHRTLRCTQQNTCIPPRSEPVHARPMIRPRAERRSSETRRPRMWNLKTKNFTRDVSLLNSVQLVHCSAIMRLS